MQDFVGKELNIGDNVVFTGYNRAALTKGTIIGFSKSLGMAKVEFERYGSVRTTQKTSEYLVKVD